MNVLKLALGQRDKKDSHSNPSKEKVFTISFSHSSNASASSSGSSFAICSPTTTKHDYGHDKLGKRKFQVFVRQPKRKKQKSAEATRNETVLIAPTPDPFDVPQYRDGSEYGGAQFDDYYYRPPQPRYRYHRPEDIYAGGNPYAFFDEHPYYPHDNPYPPHHLLPFGDLNPHGLALAMHNRPYRHHRYQANPDRPPLSHAEHFRQPYPYEPDDAQYNPIEHYHHHWRQPSVPSSLDVPDLPKKPILKNTHYEREKSVNNDLHLETNTTQNQYTDFESDVDEGDAKMSHRLTFAQIYESADGPQELPQVDPTNDGASSYDCVMKIVRDRNQRNDANENLPPEQNTILAYNHRDSLFCGRGVYNPALEEVLKEEVMPVPSKQYEQLVDVEDVSIAKLALLGVGSVPMNAEVASQPACSLNSNTEDKGLEKLPGTGAVTKARESIGSIEVSNIEFEENSPSSSVAKSGIPLAPPRKAGVGFIGEEILLSNFDASRRASRLPRTRQELMSMLESSFVSDDSSDTLADMSRKSTVDTNVSHGNSHERRGSFRPVNREMVVTNQAKHKSNLTSEMNLINRLQDKLLENSSFAVSETVDMETAHRCSSSVEDSKSVVTSPKEPQTAPLAGNNSEHDVISEEISDMIQAAHVESEKKAHVESENEEELDNSNPDGSDSPLENLSPIFSEAIQSAVRVSPQESSPKSSFAISAQSAVKLSPEKNSEENFDTALQETVSLAPADALPLACQSSASSDQIELQAVLSEAIDVESDAEKLLEFSIKKETCSTSCFGIEPATPGRLQVANQEVVGVVSESEDEKRPLAVSLQAEVDFAPDFKDIDKEKESELTVSHQETTDVIPQKRASIRGAFDLSPNTLETQLHNPVTNFNVCSFVASPQEAIGFLPDPSPEPSSFVESRQPTLTVQPESFDERSSFAISGAIDEVMAHPNFSTSRNDLSYSSYSGMSREERDNHLIERIDALLDDRFQTLNDLKEMAKKSSNASINSEKTKIHPPIKSKTKIPRNLSLGTAKTSSYSTGSTYTTTSSRSNTTKGSKSGHIRDISDSESLRLPDILKEEEDSKSDSSPMSAVRPSLHERFVISVTNKDKEAWKMKQKGPVWTRTSFGGFGLLTKFNRVLTDEDWKKHMTKRHGKPKPLKGYDFTCFYCRKTKKSYHLGKKRSQFELQCANPICRKLYKVGL